MSVGEGGEVCWGESCVLGVGTGDVAFGALLGGGFGGGATHFFWWGLGEVVGVGEVERC